MRASLSFFSSEEVQANSPSAMAEPVEIFFAVSDSGASAKKFFHSSEDPLRYRNGFSAILWRRIDDQLVLPNVCLSKKICGVSPQPIKIFLEILGVGRYIDSQIFHHALGDGAIGAGLSIEKVPPNPRRIGFPR